MLLLRPDLVDESFRTLPPARYSMVRRIVPNYPLNGGAGLRGPPGAGRSDVRQGDHRGAHARGDDDRSTACSTAGSSRPTVTRRSSRCRSSARTSGARPAPTAAVSRARAGPHRLAATAARPHVSDLALVEPAADGVAPAHAQPAGRAQRRSIARSPTALEQALERVAAMDDIRVLLVGGARRAFCAGNDIREMETITGEEAQALATRQAALMDRFCTPAAGDAGRDRRPRPRWRADARRRSGYAHRLRPRSPRLAGGDARLQPGYGIARFLDIAGGGLAATLLLSGRTSPRHRSVEDGAGQPRGRVADARRERAEVGGGNRRVTARRAGCDEGDRRCHPRRHARAAEPELTAPPSAPAPPPATASAPSPPASPEADGSPDILAGAGGDAA